MEGFDKLVGGHGESNDFWIENTTKEFLKLGESEQKGEVWFFDPVGGVRGN